jgi:hypothetical protein
MYSASSSFEMLIYKTGRAEMPAYFFECSSMWIGLGTDGSRYYYLDSQCSGVVLYGELSEILYHG